MNKQVSQAFAYAYQGGTTKRQQITVKEFESLKSLAENIVSKSLSPKAAANNVKQIAAALEDGMYSIRELLTPFAAARYERKIREMVDALKKLADAKPEVATKYAVLLIDACYKSRYGELLDVGTSTTELEEMAKVLQAANACDVPVFEFEWQHYFYTHPSLKAHAGDNWTSYFKTTDSAFDSTPLEQVLRSNGITDLILLGQNYDACVRRTAMDAIAAGLNILTSPQVVQSEYSSELPAYYAENDAVVPTGAELIERMREAAK